MSVIIDGDTLQRIVCRINGISLTERDEEYFYEPSGINYSIYLHPESVIQVREVNNDTGVNTLPVYIRINRGELHTISGLIEFILLNKFTRYRSLIRGSTLAVIFDTIQRKSRSYINEFILVNTKTYEPTLYISGIIQFPNTPEIVLLETTKKLNNISPEITTSIGRFDFESNSIISYLLSGNKLLNGVDISGNSLDDKLDIVSRWFIDSYGIKALSNLPRYWQNRSGITILDKVILPKIKGIQYTSYIRKDTSYSLVRLKLNNNWGGLLSIENGEYTIFINDWKYRLSRKFFKSFYKDFIQPGGKGYGIQRRIEDLVCDLESRCLCILERCIDDYNSGTLRVVLNVGCGVYLTLTFILRNDDIEVFGELGESKTTDPVVYKVGDFDTISNLILQLITCEGIFSEDLINELEKLK